VESLLEESGLPTAGVSECIEEFIVAESEGKLIGTIGLEEYSPSALLRSAVVSPAWQGRGIGQSLVKKLLADAETRGIQKIFLLTTTAADYFPSFGFYAIPRAEAPSELMASAEFKGACPDSATLMEKPLR
jgi:N-acetylglutamate synthase-like GNAT family acetyltransferase